MFNRHDLVWVENKNTPFVVTRQMVSDPDQLNVAECLSPDKSVLSRVATVIPKSSIIKHENALSFSKLLKLELEDQQNIASETPKASSMQDKNYPYINRNNTSFTFEKITAKCSPNDVEKIFQLLTKIKTLGFELRVFGSASWQYFTQKAFINSTSDIDLVIYINNIEKVPTLNNHLRELEQLIHRKIDSEFVHKDKYFIVIAEWLNSNSEVLVKTNSEILLISKHDPIFY